MRVFTIMLYDRNPLRKKKTLDHNFLNPNKAIVSSSWSNLGSSVGLSCEAWLNKTLMHKLLICNRGTRGKYIS